MGRELSRPVPIVRASGKASGRIVIGRTTAARAVASVSGNIPPSGWRKPQAGRQKHGKVADGADPQGGAGRRNAPTLSLLIDRYLDRGDHPTQEARHPCAYKIYLRKMIEPHFGGEAASMITRNDVAALHRKLGAELPVSANRALVTLSEVTPLLQMPAGA